jgi:hypothetical protein
MRPENNVRMALQQPAHAALAGNTQLLQPGVDDLGDLVERAHVDPVGRIGRHDREAHSSGRQPARSRLAACIQSLCAS